MLSVSALSRIIEGRSTTNPRYGNLPNAVGAGCVCARACCTFRTPLASSSLNRCQHLIPTWLVALCKWDWPCLLREHSPRGLRQQVQQQLHERGAIPQCPPSKRCPKLPAFLIPLSRVYGVPHNLRSSLFLSKTVLVPILERM